MDGELLSTLIIVIISILIFLALREVVCWYWKINERNSLLIEQNSILKNILKELKGKSNSKDISTFQKNDNESITSKEGYSRKEKMNPEVELSIEEKERVDAFIKFGIKPGERVIINKTTREINRFDKKDWGDIEQSEWIVLIEK